MQCTCVARHLIRACLLWASATYASAVYCWQPMVPAPLLTSSHIFCCLACLMSTEGDTVSVVTGAGDRETEANTGGSTFTTEQLTRSWLPEWLRRPLSHVPVTSSTLSSPLSGKWAPSNYGCLVMGHPPGAADGQRRSLPPSPSPFSPSYLPVLTRPFLPSFSPCLGGC